MSLKYMKKAEFYKNYNGNNIVNLQDLTAFSYQWWQYLAKLDNGLLVMNNSTYSNSTTKHQRQCLNLLINNNIEPDVIIEHSTSSLENLEGIIRDLKDKVTELLSTMRKPKTRKSTNATRRAQVLGLISQIKLLRSRFILVSPGFDSVL